ncbi:MAG TPA: DUF2203 family protein [Gemmataceae bacterium]|jgi:hypothetical protein
MNGFTENRAPGAYERPGPHDLVLTWGACHAMLPLVGRIVADVMRGHEQLAQLRPEQERLDRQRHTLAWPERSRRYQVQEEIAAVEKDLRKVYAELEGLGVAVLHGPSGLIGFPTIVNDRRAYFSWRPGEDDVVFWNFAGDPVRHTVPESWTKTPPAPRSRRGKSRRKQV